MLSFFKKKLSRWKNAFVKAGSSLGKRFTSLFSKPIDESTYEELEQLFYESDLGVATAEELVEKIRKRLAKEATLTPSALLLETKEYLDDLLGEDPEDSLPHHPEVILLVGVNGSGKTTAIAKLAHHYKSQGKKVLIAAADTFRAAATDQLERWAHKLGVPIIRSQKGADPSAVAYDALQAAVARDIDVVLVDTAGRLQTKTDLMEELKKMRRVIQKVVPEAPHQTLLTLDATTGQNAIDQAKTFHNYLPISHIILSKLDGSAKGGIVIAIKKELDLPVKWVGLGEREEDLSLFDKKSYLEALLSIES